MNEGTENESGMRWLAIGLGAAALVAAVVAIVLSLNAGDDDTATQSQLTDNVSQLDRRLDKIEGTATSAGEQGKQTQEQLTKAEKRAQNKEGKAQSEISSLKQQNQDQQDKIDTLTKDQAAQEQQIKDLQKQVKKLK